jgi:transposase
MEIQENEKRKTLIHLIRSGKSIAQAAKEVGKSRSWANKWWKRFRAYQDWDDLQSSPRTPKRQPRKLSKEVCQAIRQIRSELEAEAVEKDRLGYVGAFAIQARLRERKIPTIPSISRIEQELRLAGMVRAYEKKVPFEVNYPSLQPTHPLELIQADILPRFLTGGAKTACFNAIDVVSRYPGGEQYASRTAADACNFLWSVWQELGIPDYQQVDNEGCFSGGFTHPGVLGKVVRLALLLGIQVVFSPFYHPESNGWVERFHQDYAKFVWKKDILPDLSAVRQRSALFYRNYRTSYHHSQLLGRSPIECHLAYPARKIPAEFCLPKNLPVTAGQVHFIRAVDPNHQVKILNLDWDVSKAEANTGVWVTLNISPVNSTLSVFDVAPDTTKRTCLATHPFLLTEDVLPLAVGFQKLQVA